MNRRRVTIAMVHPNTRGHQRAAVLGFGIAISLAAMAGVLWMWAWAGVASAGMQTIPVAVTVSYCAAVIAGAVALALAWFCLLAGTHLLRQSASLTHSGKMGPSISIAPKIAAILLVLTLGTPPAFAQSVTDGEPAGPPTSAQAAVPGLPAPMLPIPALASADQTHTSVVLPQWQPTRTDLPMPSSPEPAPAGLNTRVSSERANTDVVVLRGDSLWSIAAQELGPGASDAAIATRWGAWYAENRLTIGPNPDVILPGNILTRPDDASPRPTIGERP